MRLDRMNDVNNNSMAAQTKTVETSSTMKKILAYLANIWNSQAPEHVYNDLDCALFMMGAHMDEPRMKQLIAYAHRKQ